MARLERSIDPALLAAMAQPVWYPIVLCEIDWPSGYVRTHSGQGDLTYDGHQWTSLFRDGKLIGGISLPEESAGFAPTEMELRIVSDYLALLAETSEEIEGRTVKAYIGATTEPGGTTLIGAPYNIFTGGISGDALDASDALGELALTVAAGTHGRMAGSPHHTDEEHQGVYPGDTMFGRIARATAYKTNPPRW